MPDSILVVDDEAVLRELLAIVLEDEGYVVSTAAHGAEALSLLGHSPVDLILTDLMMPVMDGLTLAQTLRVRRDATPILLMSAVAPTDQCPADLPFVQKPFDVDHLLAQIDQGLARSA